MAQIMTQAFMMVNQMNNTPNVNNDYGNMGICMGNYGNSLNVPNNMNNQLNNYNLNNLGNVNNINGLNPINPIIGLNGLNASKTKDNSSILKRARFNFNHKKK